MSASGVGKAIRVRVKSINDLVRMAASSIAMGQPTYILRCEREGKTIYGIMAVFRDFYKYYGIPLFYYVIDDSNAVPKEANYALLRSSDSEEKIEFSKAAKTGYVVVPIINVADMPDFLS